MFSKYQELIVKYFPKGVIAFDLETTGLSPLVDKVIEIGAVKVLPSGQTEVFQEFIDPKIEIPQNTIDIHHITDDMVSGSPTVDIILESFIDFCGELPLVAHNVQFDAGFLAYNIQMNSLSTKRTPLYCSFKLAKAVLKNAANYKLATLAEYVGHKIENHHRAVDDAIASLFIFLHSLNEVSDQNRKAILSNQALFSYIDNYKKNQLELPQNLRPLIDFTKNQTKLAMDYKGGSIRMKFRPIRPISLLPMPNGPVLYALCYLSNQHKSFALKKIRGVEQISDDKLQELLDEYDKLNNNGHGKEKQ